MNDIRGSVLRHGIGQAVVGLMVGVTGAVALERVISRLLEVTATDPIALDTTVAVLLGAATLATLVPARRAARIAPAELLQRE